MRQAVTYDRAAEILDCSVRWVRKLIRDGTLPQDYTGRKLGNGHREKGVPEPAVRAYLRDQGSIPSTKDNARAREEEGADSGHFPARQAADLPRRRPPSLPDHIPITHDGIPDLEAMREMGLNRHVETYQTRVRAVQLLRQRLKGAEHGERGFWRDLTADEFDVSTSTLRNWERRRERYGWAGLMPAWGGTRGTCRALPVDLQRAILDAWAYQGRYSIAQIYDLVVRPWFAEHDAGGLPHVSTVRRFIDRSCPEVVRTLARDGKRAYQERHEVRVVRDLESAGVNGWWVSDHRLADTFVLVPDGKGTGWPSGVRTMFCPCGSGAQRSKCCSARRPWWTVTADVASGAFVAWRVSLQPTAAVVCHMLHEAMLTWGPPEVWHRDNGKEFLAARLGGKAMRGSLPDPALGDTAGQGRWPSEPTPAVARSAIWQHLGVRLVTSLPYASWSKYIESLFGAWVRRGYEKELPGYCGSSPGDRPEKLQHELESGRLLTVDSYVEKLGQQIGRWNETRAVGRRSKAPAEFYRDYIPAPLDPQTLTFLLQDRRRQTVRHGRLLLSGQGGRQHLYISDNLARYSGVAVEVRWDPGRPEWVWVYPGDGECLAVQEVPLAEYGEWGETNLAARRASRAQRRFIREWAAPIKGACPRPLMDPTGAHREVEERAASARQQAQSAAADAVEAQQRALAEAQAEPEDEEEIYVDKYVERLNRRLG